jgi:hypothetical protein
MRTSLLQLDPLRQQQHMLKYQIYKDWTLELRSDTSIIRYFCFSEIQGLHTRAPTTQLLGTSVTQKYS